MFTIVISEKGGAERREAFDRPEISVGRVQGNDLMLPKGNVSKRHARLMLRDDRFIVTDLNSTNGTYVNRRRITQATIVREGDRIYIGDFVLRIEPTNGATSQQSGEPAGGSDSGTVSRDGDTPQRTTDSEVPKVPGPPRMPTGARLQPAELSSPARQRAPVVSQVESPMSIPAPRRAVSLPDTEALNYRATLGDLVGRVEGALGPGELDGELVGLASRVSHLLTEHSNRMRVDGRIATSVDVDVLLKDARAELLDTGPLGPLLEDLAVSEVIVSKFDNVATLRDGDEVRVEPPFTSEAALQRAVRRLCEQAHQPIRGDERVVERRLASGALLTAALAPTSVRGSVVVIRKLREVRCMLDDLVQRGMASAAVASFLEQCVAARINVLVTGPRDLGTFRVVSALCAAAVGAQHIVVQRTSELVPAEDATLFSVTGASAEAPRLVELAAMVPAAKLVVELAAPELSESLLSAVATGVDGVIGVAYASSLRRALARVPADLMAARPGLAADAAREWLAASFDIVVEVGRLADGRCRVLRVCEITGTGGSGIATQEIFAFVIDQTVSDNELRGSFLPSGVIPRVVAELQARGLAVDTTLFNESR